jgi:hypothetical protein
VHLIFEFNHIRSLSVKYIDSYALIISNSVEIKNDQPGFSVGLLYWLSHEREHCVKLYKRTLKIKITEAERIIDIVDGMNVMKSCGSIFDQNLVDTQDNLSALQGQYDSNNWTHDDIAKLATPIPEYENKLGMNSTPLVRVSRAKGFTEEITRIYTDLNLKIPGSKCDSCNILRTKTTALMKCTRCKRKVHIYVYVPMLFHISAYVYVNACFYIRIRI